MRAYARPAWRWCFALAALTAVSPFVCADPAPPVTTRTGFDLVRVREGQFTIPLRYGHVLAGSDRVELEGRALVRGREYTLDAVTGSLMLAVPVRDGTVLRVSYQYDPGASQTGVSGGGGGGAGMTFRLAPGTSATIGLGMVERNADGSVLSSNVMGLKNSFSTGGTKLSGVLFVGQRTRSQSTNLFDGGSGGASEDGQGVAIVQSLSSRLFGGVMRADFQDVDERFNAVGALNFDDAESVALSRERGLKRTAFSLSDANLFGLRQSLGVRQVGDDRGGITWRNAEAKIGGIGLSWAQQSVDPGFLRFGDLRDQDRDLLARERGLTREGLEVAGRGAQYRSDKVEGLDGNGVYRQSFGFERGAWTLAYGDQKVDPGFARFGDLRLPGRDQLAREQGMTRRRFSLGIGSSASFATSAVQTDTGGVAATDLSLTQGPWSFGVSRRDYDKGFDRASSLTGAELQEYVLALDRMFDPTAGLNGADVGSFMGNPGIDRSVARLGFAGKSSQWRLDHHVVSTASGAVSEGRFALQTPKTKFEASLLGVGRGFSEFGRLTPTEQQRLGPSAGLAKISLDLATNLGMGRSLTLSQMRASDSMGSAGRTRLSLELPWLRLDYARRAASVDFQAVRALADPERDRLAGLLGQGQSELNFQFQPIRRLEIAGQTLLVTDDPGQSRHAFQNHNVEWGLGAGWLASGRFRTDAWSKGGEDTFNDRSWSVGLLKDFGRLGRLGLQHESRRVTGSQSALPHSDRLGLVYDLPVNDRFSLNTVTSGTRYADGSQETTYSQTLDAKVNKRLSVSFTNSHERGILDPQARTTRQFGARLDFGKGIVLNLGRSRKVEQTATGTHSDQFSLAPGTFQGVQVERASYSYNGWDDTRDQHLGSFSFRNAAPLKWGALRDVRFQAVAETVRDGYLWQKEDRRYGVGANVMGASLDVGYRSQMTGDGYRAIDRTVKYVSDPTGQKPLRFSVLYGARTLPTNDEVAIRDYALSWQMAKGLQLEHSVVTNPLQHGGPFLESTPIDERRNNWSLNWTRDPSRKLGLSWREVQRDRASDALYREAMANLTLFADNPSPITMSYGLVQWDRNGQRQTSHKFALAYTQRPGPNQSLSFSLTNMNFEHSVAAGLQPNQWGLRLDFFSRK